MIKHPEVLRKAQEEVDSVVGHSRLPTFDDRPLLPYIEAMLTETMRWGCPIPLSTLLFTPPWASLILYADFPHLSLGDVYKGYRIPKGSYVRVSTTDCNVFDFLAIRCLETYG